MFPGTRFAAWAIGLACCVFAIGIPDESARADKLRVVASIKPIHSLVAGVTEGIAEPMLLLKRAASPHSYALTSSDAAALESADVVFWIGEGFEVFLIKPLKSLSGNAHVVDLAETQFLRLLPLRSGGIWEPHVDEHGHEYAAELEHTEADEHSEEDHSQTVDETADQHSERQEPYDGHLWLDPRNATALVGQIAGVLAKLDPANAAAYQANARRLMAGLAALDDEIGRTLEPVRGAPFIVFHDAFQYFERRYGLAGVGSVTASPDQPPGAKRLQQIRDAINERQAVCIFREPNFEPALIDSIAAETSAHIGVLDPEGALVREGITLYFDLLRGIAESFKACLSANS